MPRSMAWATTWKYNPSNIDPYDFMEKLRIAQNQMNMRGRTKLGIDLSGEYPKRYRCITNRYNKFSSLGII